MNKSALIIIFLLFCHISGQLFAQQNEKKCVILNATALLNCELRVTYPFKTTTSEDLNAIFALKIARSYKSVSSASGLSILDFWQLANYWPISNAVMIGLGKPFERKKHRYREPQIYFRYNFYFNTLMAVESGTSYYESERKESGSQCIIGFKLLYGKKKRIWNKDVNRGYILNPYIGFGGNFRVNSFSSQINSGNYTSHYPDSGFCLSFHLGFNFGVQWQKHRSLKGK